MAYRFQHAAAFVALLAVTASMGCYTVLKHPLIRTQKPETTEYVQESVAFSDDCMTCHDESIAAHHAIAIPRPIRTPSPSWFYYYDTPWWYPYYSQQKTAAVRDNDKKRPFDRRRMSKPVKTATGNATVTTPASSGGTLARPVQSSDDKSSTESTKKEDSGKRKAKRSVRRKRND